MCKHTHTHTHTHKGTRTRTCKHTHIHVHTHARTRTHTHTHAHTHTHTRTDARANTHIHVHARTHSSTHTHIYTHMQSILIYLYVHRCARNRSRHTIATMPMGRTTTVQAMMRSMEKVQRQVRAMAEEKRGSGAAFVVPCIESNSGRREAWQRCSLCCALH